MVVARNGELVNRFQQDSLLGAVNIKDFLDGFGVYQDVAIFPHSLNGGPDGEWVRLEALDS